MIAMDERYAKAVGSSHLEVKPDPGDVDVLIAAGAANTLGVRLMRLRIEFDAVRHTGCSGRLMMSRLKSAAATREWLRGFAGRAAAGRRLTLDDAALSALVARVLDLWLEPGCPSCRGRGMTGSYGAPQLVCTVCHGTGRRRLIWSVEVAGLAEWLIQVMDDKVAQAQRRMRRALRQS